MHIQKKFLFKLYITSFWQCVIWSRYNSHILFFIVERGSLFSHLEPNFKHITQWVYLFIDIMVIHIWWVICECDASSPYDINKLGNTLDAVFKFWFKIRKKQQSKKI